MLEIAICDDEFITANYYYERISYTLTEMNIAHRISLFTDSGKLLSELYHGKKWNVYFLDIDMPLVDGLDLGHKIHESDHDAYIVYVSIHREKVYESLKNRPFRFIPKDEFDGEILDCIRDLLQDMQTDNDDYIVLDVGSDIFRFKTDDVMYIQSMDKYVKFYTRDHEVSSSIRYKLSALEKELEVKGFIRTHKSYLVNYRAIRRILSNAIELDDRTRLPLSQMRVDQIKNTYRRLILS